MKKKTHAAFCCVSPDMLVGNGSGLEVLGHFLDFSIDVVDELLDGHHGLLATALRTSRTACSMESSGSCI